MEATLYYALYVCLFYTLGNQVLRLVWVYWLCRPVKHPDPHLDCNTKCMQDSDNIVGLPTIFGKRLTSIRFLLRGPEITIGAYRKVG